MVNDFVTDLQNQSEPEQEDCSSGIVPDVTERMSIARIICSVMNIFANNKETKEENYVEKR